MFTGHQLCRALPFFALLLSCQGSQQQATAQSSQNPAPGSAMLKDLARGFNHIYSRAKPSVVRVNAERNVPNSPSMMDPFEFFFQRPGPGGRQGPGGPGGQGQRRAQGMGTGVIINKDGTIITNNHVIGDSDKITVELHDGKTMEAKVVGTDPRTDIAVLKINSPSNLVAMEMADSDKVNVGDWALALGFPFQLSYTLTLGIISAKGRSNIGLADFEDFLQTDAAVNPGNSGGPLMDIDGRLIGINTAILAPSGAYNGISLAVPVNMARNIMESLVKTGRVVRGYLGIVPQPLDEDLARHFKLKTSRGVLIADVQAGTPADKAGLRAGDVITEVDGKPMTEVTQFRTQVADYKPGSTVNFTINRDGRVQTIKVVLAEFPIDETAANQPGSRPGRNAAPDGNGAETAVGFSMQEMTAEAAFQQYRLRLPNSRNIVIMDVRRGSPAERAGLEPGDILLEVNRRPVLNVRDTRAAIQASQKNKEILMTVLPQGFNQRRYVLIKLD